tara:strand:- start:7 stop:606 length:600 start_codon:yes stop_codon:yes gene_type:complete
MNHRYIIFTGAPGSKWSSVVKNIYWSCDLDQSDYSTERLYYHDADTPGTKQLMHLGAYWDPGMEFEPREWDLPFTSENLDLKRIVKSHVFAYELNRLKDSHPLVMVYRNDVDCIEWWKKCGHFNITYPNYTPYYIDLNNMWYEIQKQNRAIMQFVKNNLARIHQPENNIDLCGMLNLESPDDFIYHNYKEKDIKVYVYK